MVHRWDVITIGSISRNRYWGEGEERGVRPAICTCTLITGDGFRLLVDPSLQEGERMAAEMDRRSGLKPSDITAVFITHEHADHHYGLKHFPDAAWYAAPGVADLLNASGRCPKPVQPVKTRLLEAIQVLPTPGHTPEHHSLRFECDCLAVVVAGDAVMTRDFFADRRGYFNSRDPERASRTIEAIAGFADAVVPGHDNWFLTRR